jgi:hypothetical protein
MTTLNPSRLCDSTGTIGRRTSAVKSTIPAKFLHQCILISIRLQQFVGNVRSSIKAKSRTWTSLEHLKIASILRSCMIVIYTDIMKLSPRKRSSTYLTMSKRSLMNDGYTFSPKPTAPKSTRQHPNHASDARDIVLGKSESHLFFGSVI